MVKAADAKKCKSGYSCKIFYIKSLMNTNILKRNYFRLWIYEELNQAAYLVTPLLLILQPRNQYSWEKKSG